MIALLAAAMAVTSNCPNAVTTVEINRCEAQKFAAVDRALNAQWKLSMAAMKRRDAASQTPRLAGPIYAQALLTAQQHWLAFRDSNCRVWAYRVRGGTAQPAREIACRTTMTVERTRELRDQVKAY